MKANINVEMNHPNIHCYKKNLNLRMKTDPVAGATVYVRVLLTCIWPGTHVRVQHTVASALNVTDSVFMQIFK